MRVALVYRGFNREGSLARATVELASYLARSHDVHVFSIAERTDRSLAPDCTFHAVPTQGLTDGAATGRELWTFARNAARLLGRDRYDVVHVCAPGTWVADVLHVPGIVRGESELQGISPSRVALGAVRHPRKAARLALERRAFRNPCLSRVHVAAPSVREALVRFYGFDESELRLVTPAVNLDQFRPTPDRRVARAELGFDAERFVALFCGSDFRRKGLDRAIEGIAAARTPVELVVVGSGPEAAYRELARARGVETRVHFAGGRTDAHRFYQAADTLVLPTRADVWGVTPIEAMACGVPPIVSAAAGSSSAVANGATGVVLREPFDVRELAEALDLLYTNAELRHAMGRAGVIAARAHSWAARGLRVEEDLLAVAKGRRDTARG